MVKPMNAKLPERGLKAVRDLIPGALAEITPRWSELIPTEAEAPPVEIANDAPFVERERAYCGGKFQVLRNYLASYQHVCPGCKSALDDAVQSCRMEFEKLCPEIYRGTDPAKLPVQGKLAEVMAWRYGPRGLILHGVTGRGKSRCAWLLMEREIMSGRRTAALDWEAGLGWAATFKVSSERAVRWLRKLSTVEVLFLDDVFKARLTESFEAALYGIIENRTSRGLPIIATTNDTGASLKARMSDDRGQAIYRRLKEFCRSVNFGE